MNYVMSENNSIISAYVAVSMGSPSSGKRKHGVGIVCENADGSRFGFMVNLSNPTLSKADVAILAANLPAIFVATRDVGKLVVNMKYLLNFSLQGDFPRSLLTLKGLSTKGKERFVNFFTQKKPLFVFYEQVSGNPSNMALSDWLAKQGQSAQHDITEVSIDRAGSDKMGKTYKFSDLGL